MTDPISYTSTGFAGRTVSFDDVVRFEATDKYTTVYTSDGLPPMLIDDTLKRIALVHPELVLCHRAHLVKTDWIVNLARAKNGDAHYALRLKGKHGQVPVSRRMIGTLRNIIGDLLAQRRNEVQDEVNKIASRCLM